ncbi:hypothetical protein ACLKA7_005208 [Drosophila subpalustris]
MPWCSTGYGRDTMLQSRVWPGFCPRTTGSIPRLTTTLWGGEPLTPPHKAKYGVEMPQVGIRCVVANRSSTASGAAAVATLTTCELTNLAAAAAGVDAVAPAGGDGGVGDDWNAKHRLWGNGMALHDVILTSSCLKILTTAVPTHFPASENTPSVLDFCIFYGISRHRFTIRRLEQAEAFAIDLERRFRPFDTASAAHCRRVESLLDRQVDLSDSSRNHHHLRHVTLDELNRH